MKASDISAENQNREKTKPVWFWPLIKELSSMITWTSVTKTTQKHGPFYQLYVITSMLLYTHR